MVMWSCNLTPFYPIETEFSLQRLFFCDKNACTILNTAFKIFRVVTKNKCRHTSKISQQYLYNVKNIKKAFLQLYNNYSMSPSWLRSDKITNEPVARVCYNHFISNKGEWNNCFSEFSNRVFRPIFISTILQSVLEEHTTSRHRRPNFRHHLIIT